MRWVLGRYLTRSFISAFLITLLAVIGLIYLVETVEMLRRTANNGVSAWYAPALAALKQFEVVDQVFILCVLFGAMIAITRLARRSELVVMRAAGLSAWQILAPPAIAAAALAGLHVLVLNPVGSRALETYQRLEAQLLGGGGDPLAFSERDFWLRETGPEQAYILRAQRAEGTTVTGVSVFLLDEQGQLAARWRAAEGELADGAWRFRDVAVIPAGGTPEAVAERSLRTRYTPAFLTQRSRAPDHMPLWELARFVTVAEKGDLRASAYRIQLHRLLSEPLLAIAMVLVAATFTLYAPTRGGMGRILAMGVVTGMAIFVAGQMLYAVGETEGTPDILAAWSPAVATLLLGLAGVVRVEYG